MDTSRARIAALAIAGLLLAAAAASLLWDQDGGHEPAPATIALDGGAPDATGAGSARAKGERGPWVHVAGAVRRPGLYRVSAGARVAEALARAGGPRPRADLTAVNLAAPVEDGQQVVVLARGAGAQPRAGGAAAMASGQAPSTAPGGGAATISLSQATIEQLDTLDGIGPTLAQRIVEHGQANGGFRSVDELQEIDGIGPKRFEALRASVRP